MAAQIRPDLYAEVTSRILAELDRGAAPWVKPWSATPGQNVPQNAVTNRPYSGCNVILLWFTHGRGWPTPRFVTFKQAQEAGGSVRKGEHGTKVYFVKQLRITEGEGEAEQAERLVPMMREYTVFNVAQCEGLPASIIEGQPARVRNPDTRDALADDFLGSIGANIREATLLLLSLLFRVALGSLPSPVQLKDGAALAWRAALMLPSLSAPPRPAL
jgi:antirestriction protein ArdC